jgi:hypothetical protein
MPFSDFRLMAENIRVLPPYTTRRGKKKSSPEAKVLNCSFKYSAAKG